MHAARGTTRRSEVAPLLIPASRQRTIRIPIRNRISGITRMPSAPSAIHSQSFKLLTPSRHGGLTVSVVARHHPDPGLEDVPVDVAGEAASSLDVDAAVP